MSIRAIVIRRMAGMSNEDHDRIKAFLSRKHKGRRGIISANCQASKSSLHQKILESGQYEMVTA